MGVASHRQFNTRNLSFTVTGGGSAVIFTGVTATAIPGGGSSKGFAGDGDRFNTTKIADFSDPGFTFTAADLINVASVGQGATGSATLAYKDAHNQTPAAATGDLAFNLSPALLVTIDFSGPYRDYATVNGTIESWSTDGYTSPATYIVQT